MRYTFTCETGNKTTTISFSSNSNSEEALLANFFNFMKACGFSYNKDDSLKVVNSLLSKNKDLNQIMREFNEIDLRYPPPDYKTNEFLNFNMPMQEQLDLYDKGFPGISECSFDLNLKQNVSSHGHAMRAPFVGPADC